MGILKFFKKEKPHENINLDLPPLPDDSPGVSDLPDAPMPTLPAGPPPSVPKPLPDLPEEDISIPKVPKASDELESELPMPPPLADIHKELPKGVKGEEHNLPLDESLPPLPKTPEFTPISSPAEMREELPPMPKPKFEPTKEPSAKVLPSLPNFGPQPRMEVKKPVLRPLPDFAPEEYMGRSRTFARHSHLQGPLFVDIEQFRAVLDAVNTMRDELKQGEDMAFRLVNIHNNREKEFQTLHTQIEDIQRKLIFMDKTLFER